VGTRVPADPNIREVEGGGLIDMSSAGKANGSGIMMFQKV